MFFKQRLVKQGRRVQPSGTNWGSPTLEHIGDFYVTIQPFTGDDTTVNDKFSENVRDLLTPAGLDHDIRFDDVLIYDNECHQVVYVQPFDTDVIPHIEVYTGDSSEPLPDWA